MNILIDLCEKRSSMLEELVDTWKVEHDQTMAAWDTEQLCQEGIALCDLGQRMWESTKHRLFERQIDNINATGQAVLELVDNVLRVANRFHRTAVDLQQQGQDIQHVDNLARGIIQLSATREKIATKWPFVDKKLAEKAMEDYKRGDYVDSGDLLHAPKSESAIQNIGFASFGDV